MAARAAGGLRRADRAQREFDVRLFHDGAGFMELHLGDAYPRQLVFDRVLPLPISADAQTLTLFHDWYAAGYLRIV